MGRAGLEDTGIGVKSNGRIINNLRYADDHRRIFELFGIASEQSKTSSKVALELNLKKNDSKEKPRFRNSGMLSILRLVYHQGWKLY